MEILSESFLFLYVVSEGVAFQFHIVSEAGIMLPSSGC